MICSLIEDKERWPFWLHIDSWRPASWPQESQPPDLRKAGLLKIPSRLT